MNGEAERLLGRYARNRAGIFTRQDALAAGIPSGTVATRIRTGLWVAEFGQGLRSSTTPLTADARERAALARLGDGAALSHLSAARRWGMDPPSHGEVWATVSVSRRPRPIRGVRVVRSRHVGRQLTCLVDGVPVLEPARTIADLALVLDQRQLTALALSAVQRELCSLDDIRRWQVILAGRPGSAILTAALDEADPAFEPILSADFGRLVDTGGIPLIPQYVVELPDGGRVLCDFADPVARIDFEVDGLAYHTTPHQVARDKARDRRLLAVGWVTVRYDTHDVRRRPRDTLADVRRQRAARQSA